MTPQGWIIVVLAVLLLVTAGYLVIVLRQIAAVRGQLEDRGRADAPRPVTLALVVPQLELLTARVNDTVRRAREASTRTRQEEQSIRAFIADISHDLRTPLTSVRGYLQLLERSELTPGQREHLAIAQRQAEELGALVDRLYEYAYLLAAQSEPAAEPVDIGVLVGECLLGMTGQIEEAGLEVEADLPTGLMVDTDRESLTRIVQNLVRNAVQHGRGTLAVRCAREADGLLLSVTNGVTPDRRIDTARMFDRFVTADDSRSGRTSGLGLSIVQVLVERLGGTVQGHHDPSAATLRIEVRVPVAGR